VVVAPVVAHRLTVKAILALAETAATVESVFGHGKIRR
jgi:hypothetical protein